MEQSAAIYAASPSKEAAEVLVEALRSEFFVGYTDLKERQKKHQVEELLAMQKMSFTMTPTAGGGAVLEMKPREG